jgi:hypothetical protein
MITDGEKNRLIAFGQHIEEKLRTQIHRNFLLRPHLPGHSDIEGGHYLKYNLNITFSLKHLLKTHDSNKNANITEQVALVFVNEIMLSLFSRIINSISIGTSVNAKSINSIINYARRLEIAIIISGSSNILGFREHVDFKENSNIFNVGPNEPYMIGQINNIYIYENPIELNSDKSIYLITSPVIDYGIAINRETILNFTIKENDVEVSYNPIDVFYKIAGNTDSFKTFYINDKES